MSPIGPIGRIGPMGSEGRANSVFVASPELVTKKSDLSTRLHYEKLSFILCRVHRHIFPGLNGLCSWGPWICWTLRPNCYRSGLDGDGVRYRLHLRRPFKSCCYPSGLDSRQIAWPGSFALHYCADAGRDSSRLSS